jgi:hypothetical protein
MQEVELIKNSKQLLESLSSPIISQIYSIKSRILQHFIRPYLMINSRLDF